MANQELYDKRFNIPPDVLNIIRTTLVSNPHGEGVRRAKFILNNGYITYQAMKRMKNFFDNANPQTTDKVQYALTGGEPMKQFIETTLNQERAGVDRSKNARQDVTNDMKVDLVPNTNVSVDRNSINEEKKGKTKNVVAVIVNSDNKILLLKRGSTAPWMPNKWSLVGGGVDKGETAQQACEREILEETGLEIKKFIKSFTIDRNQDSIENVFACRYDGDSNDIILDAENSNYGWYDVSEMEFLDIVPHLIEYITLVFKSYDD